MTVLAISSQVVAGHVGNSAAQFVLETLGHDVWAIPTVLLSHHPGHGAPAGRRTPAPEIDALLASLWDGGWMAQVTAVMTGYFTSADQVRCAATTIARLKRDHPGLPVLIDPIIGDAGTTYVPDDVPLAIRDHLLPLATITTPNLFELTVLADAPWPAGKAIDVAALAARLDVAETLVTSTPGTTPDLIATTLLTGNDSQVFETPEFPAPPKGVGDVAAAVYLGVRLRGLPCRQAATAATSIVSAMIAHAAKHQMRELPLIACRETIASTVTAGQVA